MNDDVLIACTDLADRAGATSFEIGWTCPHTPDEGGGHHCGDETWWAIAQWKGARLMVESHPSPSGAALALAERILTGGACRCGQPVALSDGATGCRWRLTGKRWEPGCDAPPIRVKGRRGDLPAIERALNREQRRRKRKGGKS
jgi:hypothetical protein